MGSQKRAWLCPLGYWLMPWNSIWNKLSLKMSLDVEIFLCTSKRKSTSLFFQNFPLNRVPNMWFHTFFIVHSFQWLGFLVAAKLVVTVWSWQEVMKRIKTMDMNSLTQVKQCSKRSSFLRNYQKYLRSSSIYSHNNSITNT